MYMAPVPLSHVVAVLRLVGNRRLPGILQVSGDRDVSYAEAALMGARIIGADAQLVRPARTLDTNLLSEQPSRHTTLRATVLNVDRLRSTLGIEPPDVRWTIEMAFGKY
jgi:dTDP-4-dehydrorhamnose reductase